MDLNPRAVFAVLLVAGIALLLYIDRNKIERHSILFMRKTQKGIRYFDYIAKLFPRFWKNYARLGVAAGILSIFLMIAQLGFIIYLFTVEGTTEGGPAAILPGLTSDQTISGNVDAGVMTIPIEYWVISIAIIMVVHESSHAIVARLNDFEISSVGWLVFGIIPGAFVEPKSVELGEGAGAAEIWDQGTYMQRLEVLAAGSWANYITGAVFAGLFFLSTMFILPQYYTGDIHYNTLNGTAAHDAGMTSGTLQSIDGQEFSTAREASEIISGYSPGDNVTVETSEGSFEVTRGGEDEALTGLTFSYPSHITWLVNLFAMVAFLNVAIGLFNMLPAKPLDGGHMVDTLASEFGGEKAQSHVNHLSVVMWLTVVVLLVAALVL